MVNACWHTSFIEDLEPRLLPGGRLSRELMVAATMEPTTDDVLDLAEPTIFKAVEALTKGIEVPLPPGTSFKDKYGIERRRVRWWKDDATTYQTAALLDESLREALTDAALPQSARVFDGSSVPIFGHSRLTGTPALLTENIACVDYSVGHRGPLCAYRWSGEAALTADHLTWIAAPAVTPT